MCSRRKSVSIIPAKLICAPCHQHYRSFYLSTLSCRHSCNIRTKIIFIKVPVHIFRKHSRGRHIVFFPQVKHLYSRRVRCSIHDGLITFRLRKFPVLIPIRQFGYKPAAVIIFLRKIIGSFECIFRSPLAKVRISPVLSIELRVFFALLRTS